MRFEKTAGKKVAQEIVAAPIHFIIKVVERRTADAGPDLEDDEVLEEAQSSYGWEDAQSSGGNPRRKRSEISKTMTMTTSKIPLEMRRRE
jgi:hypothetical protein